MTMTETEELKWLRVLYIEDSPITCTRKMFIGHIEIESGCKFEAAWHASCSCGQQFMWCNQHLIEWRASHECGQDLCNTCHKPIHPSMFHKM